MIMKGISTLVTTVMVLAVAIAVVGIFSGWAPNLVEDVIDSTENQTTSQVSCNQASLEIESARYNHDDTTDSNWTAVAVRNSSQEELGDVRVEVWRDDLPQNNTVELLDEGFETVNVTLDEDQTPDRVEAVSLQCDNAEDTLTNIAG